MVSAIIAAGGKGLRMGQTVRKQYLLLAGVPILSRTLRAFDACDAVDKILLVVPEEDFDFCRKSILSPFNLRTKINLIPGGIERQDSVYNGLLAAETADNGIVVIHDGVRPFVCSEQIATCIAGAQETGACILGIPALDSVKIVNRSGYIDQTLERDAVWLAQTPQAFQYLMIRQAHESARQDGFTGTDDALLVERMRKRVKVLRGSKLNMKITTAQDLTIAEAMLQAVGL